MRGPEELHFSGRELFIYFPEGMGRSKLPVPAIEKQMGTPGTARNWNTVVKLLEMAEALETVAVKSALRCASGLFQFERHIVAILGPGAVQLRGVLQVAFEVAADILHFERDLRIFLGDAVTGISTPPWSTLVKVACAPSSRFSTLRMRWSVCPAASRAPSHEPRSSFATAGLGFGTSTLGSPARVNLNGKDAPP